MPAAEPAAKRGAPPAIAARRPASIDRRLFARRLGPFAPLAIYFAITLVLFGTSGSWSAQYFGGGDSDVFAYIWFLNWWPFALAHHLNPFVTNYLWHPGGYNLTWAASVPFAALLGLPATLTAGPTLAYNLLTLSAPPLAAWTAFLLAHYLTRNWPAALFGGYLFGFSSYEIAKLIGQLNLDMIWLIPLAALLCAARARGHIGRAAFIASLTALLICQLGLSTEISLTASLFGALSWAIFLLFAARPHRRALVCLAAEAAAAAGATIIIAAPFFLSLVQGLSDIPPQFNSPSFFSADPINYVVPTIVTWLGGAAAAPLADQFPGGLPGRGAYLGLPLILLIALHYRQTLRNRAAQASLAILCALLILSLGPVLHIDGRLTQIPLPWALAAHIPILNSLLPTRFTLYVALAAGLLTAQYLAAPATRRQRIARYAIALAACIALLPNPASLPWTPLPTQPFFTARNINAALGPMPNILYLPFGGDGPGAVLQIEAGMSFTQSGGYLGYVPRHEAEQQITDDLFNGVTDPTFATAFPKFCASHQINFILIGPDAEPPLVTAITAEHWPQTTDHGITIIRVPGTNGPLSGGGEGSKARGSAPGPRQGLSP